MRYMVRMALVVLWGLLWVTPALAQGQLFIDNPTGRLDRAAIERAAQPLLRRDARVAVYLVQSGGDADFNERLIEDGLARSNGLVRNETIALYVALDQRYSAIRFGDDWNFALNTADNYEQIRTTAMNPGLSSGDFTAAMTNSLAAIEQAIINPPSADGSIDVDTTPIAIGGGVLAALAAAGAVGVQVNRTRKRRGELERKLKEAREGAGVLIADLGQRFRNAQEKAQFDRVSYAASDVERLAKLQQTAQQAFATVQTTFDDVGEQLDRSAKPADEQISEATKAYKKVEKSAEKVVEQVTAIEELRRTLDAQATTAREEIDRAKKA